MADPAEVARRAARFREERADGKATLETLLEVDDAHETWTFDDLPVDSGTFGELVSRDLVTKVDGEYRVASREGIRAGLTGESVASSSNADDGFEFELPVSLERPTVGAVLASLVFLVAMRLLNAPAVFRDGTILSPGNDPYYFRYWMDRFLAESNGPTDIGLLADMPGDAALKRPLTHATNWFLAEFVGPDAVAAWLPVVATLLLGVLVYWLAVIVTDDVRVGIAAIVLLALTPVHAVYSGVGFLEHLLHQYLWLGVTLVAFAWLAVDVRRRRLQQPNSDSDRPLSEALSAHLRTPWTWVAAVALGVGLSFSALAWGGSILMFVPAAGYIGLKVAMDARDGVSPALAAAPIVAGLLVASGLTAFFHFQWDWQNSFVAIVPVLTVVATIVIAALAEGWVRLEWPTTGLVGLEVVCAVAGIFLFRQLRPADWARLTERADDLFLREGLTESASLFSADLAVIHGPMSQLGIQFYVALVVLLWTCWVAYRRYEPAWLLLSVYVVFWVAMAAIQVRFAAQLAIPLSILGGLGLVHLTAWVDLARVPVPFRTDSESTRAGPSTAGRARRADTDGGESDPNIVRPTDASTVAYLTIIALIVCGMSLIFVPSLVAQTAHTDGQYEAATAIDDHAESIDREYPQNFVLSEWPDNRMYNYLVNGEADSFAYANAHYDEFQTADDPDSWYEEFRSDDVGYVVVGDTEASVPENATQSQLHDELGTGGEDGDGLSHYRLLATSDDVSAFAVVPGATIETTTDADGPVTVTTEQRIDGESITYEREVEPRDGTLEVTVPYSGEYTVDGETVTVDEADVLEGNAVDAS
ncbi:MFS transporter [Halostagnicola kamekurae]|uniref:Dolichyl-diphosphooligosaccharide--protein glycosyltransferase n=1 Tax=Halostagnicola kamekurae TaxID=619731 RepID=A0A1I6SR79_9EURY|nr:MFS transporter [Halostagnicola kamekurae]SFS79436.1 dolichyl-diphosphooligosaccharide--protein glycosyltransferase [Halostagnicola kamekurae]